MATYSEIFRDSNGYIPERMTNARAAEILNKLLENQTDNPDYSLPYSIKELKQAVLRANALLQPAVKPTLEGLLEAVMHDTGTTREVLSLKCRCSDYSEARYAYFWLAHEYTDASLTQIGSLVNRDHCMVIYGVHRVDDYLKTPAINEKYFNIVKNIIKRIEKNN